ncbi:unnamed protein product [Jaminaea pallidilutea]
MASHAIPLRNAAALIGRRALYRNVVYPGQSSKTTLEHLQEFNKPATRAFSASIGSKKDTANKGLAQTVADELRLPFFSIQASKTRLIHSPTKFYEAIEGIIKGAQNRIFISSLYIGKDDLALVGCIRDALASRPNLRAVILVDALRSTREGPFADGSNGQKPNTSCASLLASLVRDFPDQVDVCLYRTPGLPLWLEKIIGKRVVEGAGLQHMKVYGGDDEFIISGANLSHDYFTNRQDRYIHIREQRSLSNYLHSLVLLACQFSYRLYTPGNSELETSGKPQGSIGLDVKKNHSPYSLEWARGSDMLVAERKDGSVDESGTSALSPPEFHFADTAGEAVRSFTRRWREHSEAMSKESSGPVVRDEMIKIVPLLQMGPMRITHETDAMPLILSLFQRQIENNQKSQRGILDLTSGYFSLFPAYKSLLFALPSSIHTRIIAASPESNGFFNSKGVSRHIPPAYTWLESKFWNAVKRAGKTKAIQIKEWSKSGWTYHSKGVWLSSVNVGGQEASSDSSTSELAASRQPPLLPTHTLIGSSNFGSRSALRDLECTLLVEASTDLDADPPTRIHPLSKALGEEVEALRKDAKVDVDDELFRRQDRQVHWGVRIATEVIKDRL